MAASADAAAAVDVAVPAAAGMDDDEESRRVAVRDARDDGPLFRSLPTMYNLGISKDDVRIGGALVAGRRTEVEVKIAVPAKTSRCIPTYSNHDVAQVSSKNNPQQLLFSCQIWRRAIAGEARNIKASFLKVLII